MSTTPWPLRSHHTQLTLNRLTKRQVHEMIVRVAVRVRVGVRVRVAVRVRVGVRVALRVGVREI